MTDTELLDAMIEYHFTVGNCHPNGYPVWIGEVMLIAVNEDPRKSIEEATLVVRSWPTDGLGFPIEPMESPL